MGTSSHEAIRQNIKIIPFEGGCDVVTDTVYADGMTVVRKERTYNAPVWWTWPLDFVQVTLWFVFYAIPFKILIWLKREWNLLIREDDVVSDNVIVE